MNYYISDLHLLHKNCIGFDERPFADLEEMHETILANWNRKVTNSDTVYILGDATLYGKKEDAIAMVARMKGKKVLVRGNHDHIDDYRYQQLYEEICDYKGNSGRNRRKTVSSGSLSLSDFQLEKYGTWDHSFIWPYTTTGRRIRIRSG